MRMSPKRDPFPTQHLYSQADHLCCDPKEQGLNELPYLARKVWKTSRKVGTECRRETTCGRGRMLPPILTNKEPPLREAPFLVDRDAFAARWLRRERLGPPPSCARRR